ncbi:MAG: hypothetical protein HYX76_15590 [Acidobacteria bacterium]|nr:hypothetical protein [Acidobacteriota bacterium]
MGRRLYVGNLPYKTTDEEAQKAIAEFHQYQLEGRALVVNEARPKPEGGGGRQFGDGGGFDRSAPDGGPEFSGGW